MLLTKLKHPYVLPLIGLLETRGMRKRGLPAMVQKYCVHGSLKRFLEKSATVTSGFPGDKTSATQAQPIGLQVKLSIVTGVAEALKYVASYGYVHRDVAARNILIDEHLVPKLTGFQSAVLLPPGQDSITGLIEAGQDPVPLRWAPPEVVLKNTCSEQSDVWAFGVLLYEVFGDGVQPYVLAPAPTLPTGLSCQSQNPRPSLHAVQIGRIS